jgi:hypothetical protein
MALGRLGEWGRARRPVGRKSRRATGRIFRMTDIRAGFEPCPGIEFVVDLVVTNPRLPLLHSFKATNDNAQTLLLGTTNPRCALPALL